MHDAAEEAERHDGGFRQGKHDAHAPHRSPFPVKRLVMRSTGASPR